MRTPHSVTVFAVRWRADGQQAVVRPARRGTRTKKRGDRGRRHTVGWIERGSGDGGDPARSPLGDRVFGRRRAGIRRARRNGRTDRAKLSVRPGQPSQCILTVIQRRRLTPLLQMESTVRNADWHENPSRFTAWRKQNSPLPLQTPHMLPVPTSLASPRDYVPTHREHIRPLSWRFR